MAISVQRVENVDPEVVIIVGSNDHMQSRGLLNSQARKLREKRSRRYSQSSWKQLESGRQGR